MSKRKPSHVNKYGAYICEPCSNGDHLAMHHAHSQHALCQCACDGLHTRDGRLKPPQNGGRL